MMHSNFLWPLVLFSRRPIVFTAGVKVDLRREGGVLLFFVFIPPLLLSVGPADISLLLQNRNGLDPVLDANISLLLRSDTSANEVRVRPTRERARNKLLYAAPVTLPESGKWLVAVTILRDGARTDATGTIHL